jgi:hypothetical protein
VRDAFELMLREALQDVCGDWDRMERQRIRIGMFFEARDCNRAGCGARRIGFD